MAKPLTISTDLFNTHKNRESATAELPNTWTPGAGYERSTTQCSECGLKIVTWAQKPVGNVLHMVLPEDQPQYDQPCDRRRALVRRT
jgi:hypothetical protein